jgi:hypothetical protein
MWPRRGVIGGVSVAVLLLVAALTSSQSRREGPAQPIDFSHRAHEIADKLDCEFCHSTARRSAFAGMPPLERCIGCHRYVATAHPDVVALTRDWDQRTPIHWTQVNVLPRFVHFTHEAHVRAGVACQECHGPVEQMDRVAAVRDLTMGWCLGCHRQRGAAVDCLSCHY